jgi:Flp pilus assembly protein TadD
MTEAREPGMQALRSGDFDAAVAHLTAARQEHPSDFAILEALGVALYKRR